MKYLLIQWIRWNRQYVFSNVHLIMIFQIAYCAHLLVHGAKFIFNSLLLPEM